MVVIYRRHRNRDGILTHLGCLVGGGEGCRWCRRRSGQGIGRTRQLGLLPGFMLIASLQAGVCHIAYNGGKERCESGRIGLTANEG